MLTAMVLLPLVAAAIILLWRGESRDAAARWIGLVATVIVLAIGLVIWSKFDGTTAAFQFVERYEVFGGLFSWHMGVDGISLFLVILSAFLMPITILSGWDSVQTRVPEYVAVFMLMEALMIGVFATLDLILFYFFFEGSLIPMYMIIGIWGGKRRVYASYKFFLYTLLGSVVMLLGMLWIASAAGTTDIPVLMGYDFPVKAQFWLWIAFFASFAVKLPMWPVHTWLPDAHVEAPTAGSIILAGVLLKMGAYGFVRFLLPMFPEASVQMMWFVFALSMIGLVYTSLVALVQEDMKKLVAYSSVAHMAFVTAGLFAFNQQGIEGAVFVMLAHGVVSAALFYTVGVVYERLHTREISRYGGVASNMRHYAAFFMIFTMSALALPGTAGFIGEFLSVTGVYHTSSQVGLVMVTGVILSAAYMLWLYGRVMFGPQKNADAAAMPDLNIREWIIMLPLAGVTLWMGLYPKPFLQPMRAPVESLVARLQQANPPATPYQFLKDVPDWVRARTGLSGPVATVSLEQPAMSVQGTGAQGVGA